MNRYELTRGEGRTRVSLSVHHLSSDIVVCIYNENAHISAVALGEYGHKEQRASTSVVTRLGHKDDILAKKAAHLITKYTKKPTCVIAGIHIDSITEKEIDQVLQNTTGLVDEIISRIE